MCTMKLHSNNKLDRKLYKGETISNIAVYNQLYTRLDSGAGRTHWSEKVADIYELIGTMQACGNITAKKECNHHMNYTPEFPIRNYCYNRICPKCYKQRALRLLKLYEPKVFEMKHPRFMTLTYAGHHKFSFEVIKEIQRCWKRLSQFLRRKRGIWCYIKALEINHKDEDGKYYYHLHVIYDGKYIPKQRLSDLWLKYTKTSYIVDISRVKRKFNLMGYLVKYISKCQLYITINEYLDVKNKRFFHSFGFKNIPLPSYDWDHLEHLLMYSFCHNCDHKLQFVMKSKKIT